MPVALEVSTRSALRRWEVAPGGTKRTQLLPLLRGEDTADGKGHLRVGLLKRCARGGDAVDGVHYGAFIRVLGLKQGFQLDLFFFQVGVDVDELQAAVLEDLLDLLHLAVAETEGF